MQEQIGSFSSSPLLPRTMLAEMALSVRGGDGHCGSAQGLCT